MQLGTHLSLDDGTPNKALHLMGRAVAWQSPVFHPSHSCYGGLAWPPSLSWVVKPSRAMGWDAYAIRPEIDPRLGGQGPFLSPSLEGAFRQANTSPWLDGLCIGLL